MPSWEEATKCSGMALNCGNTRLLSTNILLQALVLAVMIIILWDAALLHDPCQFYNGQSPLELISDEEINLLTG